MIKKLIISLTILTSLAYISYINLGNIVDSTTEPKKVDLLVCLGGGDYNNRILLFTELFGEGDFDFSVVASEFNWDSQKYYKSEHMKTYVYSEVLKTFYNVFLYGVADSIGLKDEVENLVYKIVDNKKKEFYVAFHEGLR